MTDAQLRALLTGVVVLVIVVTLLLMLRGWRRRGHRQADLPVPSDTPLPGVADGPAELPDGDSPVRLGPVTGRYLATTSTGDWLDRIVVHGLGVPSRAEVTVRDDGVLVQRTGARDVFVPVGAVRGARLDRAIAGAVYEDGGLVVLTWQLGGHELDTGFRADQPDGHGRLAAALAGLGGAPVQDGGAPGAGRSSRADDLAGGAA